MLLTYGWARYYEICKDSKKTIDFAKSALDQAERLGEEDYAIKIKMFLFHIYMELGDKEKSMRYYAFLFPLDERSAGRFKWHYRSLVLPHEKDILNYLNKQTEMVRGKIGSCKQNELDEY